MLNGKMVFGENKVIQAIVIEEKDSGYELAISVLLPVNEKLFKTVTVALNITDIERQKLINTLQGKNDG